MKIGQTFPLPSDAYRVGQCGNVIENEQVVGRYEVVKEGGELLGKVIVTYTHGGNKRNSKRSADRRNQKRLRDATAHYK